MAKDKNQYVTVAPVTPKGKWLVASRRIGSKERLTPFCECRTEIAADAVVEALNLMQGELVKLELPAQRVLEETRGALAKERALITTLRLDLKDEQRRVATLRQELNVKSNELGKLAMALKAAQEKAREEV